ncbi:MAG: nucleotidyltransferase domain-containing protein [Candidatus Aminicenantes bacterium]|nr:nucleotidyltransferase domain-containing protein [Candidatus Aminicenantes bacterium]
MWPIDVLPNHLEIILGILEKFVPGPEVRAFGSRVTGKARRHSDLDLAIMTERPLDVAVLAGMNAAFSESDLPFTLDILDWAVLEEHVRSFICEGSVIIREATERL